MALVDLSPEANDFPTDAAEKLPFVRDPRKPLSPKQRDEVTKQIRRSIRTHGQFELAAAAAGLPFEVLEQWLIEDEHLRVTLLKDAADLKEKLAREAGDINALQAARKMSLELLGRLDKAWAPRSRTTLLTQLQDALTELEKLLPAEVYNTILATFQKHA
jgi:hypothetical protein